MQAPPAWRAWPHTDGRLPSQDLIKVHRSFLRAIDLSMMAGGGTLAKVFLEFKERCVPGPAPSAGLSGSTLGPCRADGDIAQVGVPRCALPKAGGCATQTVLTCKTEKAAHPLSSQRSGPLRAQPGWAEASQGAQQPPPPLGRGSEGPKDIGAMTALLLRARPHGVGKPGPWENLRLSLSGEVPCSSCSWGAAEAAGQVLVKGSGTPGPGDMTERPASLVLRAERLPRCEGKLRRGLGL